MQGIVITSALLIIPIASVADAAWFDSDYQYCRKMTMTAGGGSGGVATTTTAGFALVATSTISSLAATSSAGRIYEISTGSGTTTPIDFVVTNGTDCNDAGGALIDFYFEKYVSTTGEFVLWVEPDDISSTTAKTILMYYGYADASATDQSDETGVFGSLGEVGVWNLHEDPSVAGSGGIKDSTSNGNHGTDQGSMTTSDQVPGQVDGSFYFDDDDVIEIPTASSTENFTQMTITAWIYIDDADCQSQGSRIVSKDSGSGGSDDYALMCINSGGDIRARIRNSSESTVSCDASTANMNTNQWYHIAMTYDGAEIQNFLDGSSIDSACSQTGALAVSPTNLTIGDINGGGGTRSFEGGIDDVRILNKALDPNDILTIYNNTLDSASFWTFGNEETEDSGPTPAARIIRLTGGIRLLPGVRLR